MGNLSELWRPITALALTTTACAGVLIPSITIPVPMWELMTVFMGVYGLGRSAEKTVTSWKGNPNA